MKQLNRLLNLTICVRQPRKAQRTMVIYQQRQELLGKEDVSEIISNMRYGVAEKLFHDYVPHNSMEEQWDLEGLEMRSDKCSSADVIQYYWSKSQVIIRRLNLRIFR